MPLSPGPLCRAASAALRSYPDAKHGFQSPGPRGQQLLPITVYVIYIQKSAYAGYQSGSTESEAFQVVLGSAHIALASFSRSGLLFTLGFSAVYLFQSESPTGLSPNAILFLSTTTVRYVII